MSEPLRAARVRVPSSTSNLGGGYDTLGLALDRYLEASFEPSGSASGLEVEREGSLARLEGDVSNDLVAQTFTSALAAAKAAPTGRLHLTSNIPVVRGLGSSAAAILAGYDLARAALGLPRADADAFAAAYAHEGHGDNTAPSLYGGLRGVVQTLEGVKVIGLPLSDAVGFAYAAPSAGFSTKEARAVLPGTVSHSTAVSALGRITALVTGLATADAELIRIGVEDELHVPHRLPLIPGAASAMSAGYDAGAWAVTISGAGSGLIAMCEPDDAEQVAAAMRAMFSLGGDDPECVGFAVRPDLEGLRRI
jgi:homoserine kinase